MSFGDDGQEGISIGQETAEAEAYTEVQEYCKAQKQLGVLLTICSKNEPENARLGLSHPDSVLHEDDFVAIKANWEPKDRNLVQTAAELSLLPESFVFVDDNPAEREIVSAQIAGIAVPEFQDPADCIRVLDHAGYFETTTFSAADANRSEMYRANAQRAQMQQTYANYTDYLLGLDMHADIRDFDAVALPRIVQLTNKSNQFNLTTRRYTQSEMEQVAADHKHIRLYGRLRDKFGDNGIVSVVIGEISGDTLHRTVADELPCTETGYGTGNAGHPCGRVPEAGHHRHLRLLLQDRQKRHGQRPVRDIRLYKNRTVRKR